MVTTISDTANRFLGPHLQALRRQGHTIHLACRVVEPIKSQILASVGAVHDLPLSRSPLSLHNLHACTKLLQICRSERYDIIHVHTPVAAVVGRIAAAFSKIPYVIYTAHGFHFYRGAPLQAWLLWFPIEWILSIKTDLLQTMNQEDFENAERFFRHPVHQKIPGIGFQPANDISLITSDLRDELDLEASDQVILSVGEINENKGHNLIVRALSLLPKSYHYVLAGQGPNLDSLRTMSASLHLKDRVHFLGHRTDVLNLMTQAQTLVHPSIREGLPVTVMEALSQGLPVVGSDIRGLRDLVGPESGILVDTRDPRRWARAISQVATERERYPGGPDAMLPFSVENCVTTTLISYENIGESISSADHGKHT